MDAERRIIPARAGFTGPSSARRGRDRDHPRSRGVYCGTASSQSSAPGSSPLARGLHAPRLRMHYGTGIIPARAGFTARTFRARGPCGDHPRSHGVYEIRGRVKGSAGGSSPLARGLRRSSLWFSLLWGIIPARAGFTTCGDQTSPRSSDHPRSRGVYRPSGPSTGSRGGSSPLARGLLLSRGSGRGGGRIIPARAGFTRVWGRLHRRHRDHPRSRGVYPTDAERPTWADGSSPLARGLRAARRPARGGGGIIPARAGFTSTPPSTPPPRPDHPRSRGVYCPASTAARSRRGSSPLARGLRAYVVCNAICHRIIPARAGFTGERASVLPRGWDHPRSRGVYSIVHAKEMGRYGSSPLARGLLGLDPPSPTEYRIIPARAGFTISPLRFSRYGADHPRSRGVYDTLPTKVS